jgi:hypothetical protein
MKKSKKPIGIWMVQWFIRLSHYNPIIKIYSVSFVVTVTGAGFLKNPQDFIDFGISSHFQTL